MTSSCFWQAVQVKEFLHFGPQDEGSRLGFKYRNFVVL